MIAMDLLFKPNNLERRSVCTILLLHTTQHFILKRVSLIAGVVQYNAHKVIYMEHDWELCPSENITCDSFITK